VEWPNSHKPTRSTSSNTEWQQIEPTFGWFGRYRRLARDYEHMTAASEAMTYLASIRRTLKLAVKGFKKHCLRRGAPAPSATPWSAWVSRRLEMGIMVQCGLGSLQEVVA
jgi:hypothetical protein